MGTKDGIRNEHREAFAAGKFEEIPQHVLNLLKLQAEEKKAKEKPVKKEDKSE